MKEFVLNKSSFWLSKVNLSLRKLLKQENPEPPVAVLYAVKYISPTGPVICDRLEKLYQGKVIFKEVENFNKFKEVHIRNVKHHVIVLQYGFGRIANLIDILHLFQGQKVTVLRIVKTGGHPLIELDENHQLTALNSSTDVGTSGQGISEDVLNITDAPFHKDHQNRLLQFIGRAPLHSVEEVNAEKASLKDADETKTKKRKDNEISNNELGQKRKKKKIESEPFLTAFNPQPSDNSSNSQASANEKGPLLSDEEQLKRKSKEMSL